MKGVKKGCLDSSEIMKVINSYINQAKDEVPISSVEIFNSKEGYDQGETLSQPPDFYKNCIVTIWFDVATGKPYNFYFYSSDGKVLYEGPRWQGYE